MSGGGTSSEAQSMADAYERYVAIYARCMSGARLSEADLSEEVPPPKRAMFDTAPHRQPYRRVRYTGPRLLAIAIAARDAAQGQELRTPAALREELDRLGACPTTTPPPQAADPSERLTTMPACKS